MKTQSKKINLKAAVLFLLIAGNTKLHSGPCSTTNLEYIAGGMVFKVY